MLPSAETTPSKTWGIDIMDTIDLSFTVEETNIILTALSKLPYEVVYKMVEEIQEIANEQLDDKPKEEK